MIASTTENKMIPPSRMGIGKRFIINNETLIRARKFKTDTSPVLKLSLKPSFAVSPSITVMRSGPDTAFVRFMPLKSKPMLLIVRANVSQLLCPEQ